MRCIFSKYKHLVLLAFWSSIFLQFFSFYPPYVVFIVYISCGLPLISLFSFLSWYFLLSIITFLSWNLQYHYQNSPCVCMLFDQFVLQIPLILLKTFEAVFILFSLFVLGYSVSLITWSSMLFKLITTFIAPTLFTESLIIV